MATVLLLCWRDSTHPQGGGAEHYLETMGESLVAAGHKVFYRTARYPGAARREHVRGMHMSRGGGRITVYPRALAAIIAARFGKGPLADMGVPDVIIDTQNGVPFFAHCVTRAPVVLLQHHCHREQWPVAGPGLAQLGWFLEAVVSPRVHRNCQYITVSEPSKRELMELGVDDSRIAVVPNGCDPIPPGIPVRAPEADNPPAAPAATGATVPEPAPPAPPAPLRLVTLSRLVPHKQIEHAISVLNQLLDTHPDVQLDIVGDGWWKPQLRRYIRQMEHTTGRPLRNHITFHGHLTEEAKHQVLARAHVHLMPSRKEGWGLAVMEAAQHQVPSIGYRSSRGLTESIQDGTTGFLVGDCEELVAATDQLLRDSELRHRLGEAAARNAARYHWEASAERFRSIIVPAIVTE
ncbi:MAG: glycosyltransferase family 4 protein [Lawsonella sp.]